MGLCSEVESPTGFNSSIIRFDRARWGASGALSPTIRYSGVEFPAEAGLFLVSASASGVDGWGPAQRTFCKPRQDREVAAVAGWSLVRQSASPELTTGVTQGKDGRGRVHGHVSPKTDRK